MPSLLEYALRYATLGWPVFPLAQGGKTPAGALAPHGFKDATRDPATIRRWWSQGAWNIGVPTGAASGFWVLDVDPRNGGLESLEALTSAHGALSTLAQVTGGGGTHYLFAADAQVRRGKLGPGLDVKRDGGYIVVEPSTTTAAYGFADWEVFEAPPEIRPAPSWLLALCAEAQPAPAKPSVPSPAEPWDGDLPRLRSALGTISAGQYEDWIRVGAALYHASGGAPEALAEWDAWSATADNYEPQACAKRWPGFGAYAGGSVAGLGTVYYLARERGWRTAPAAPAGDVARSEDWRALLFQKPKGGVADCRENVAITLLHHPALAGALAYDDFAHGIVKRKRVPWGPSGEWTAADDLELGMWLGREMSLLVRSEQTLAHGVSFAAYRARFHPIREWLAVLEWDGVERVDNWMADFLGARPGEYTTLVGRYFLLNMVARVMDPGCICRQVPVLEGAQDKGKSSALRALAQPWFSDSMLDLQSKDAYVSVQGVWLQEIAEMQSFNRADSTRVKEFVSSRQDKFRPPYERRDIKAPRQVVFAGSTNDHIYLKDWTGNTRFHPVECAVSDEIKIDALHEMREQLFAEAVHLHQAGTRRHPTDDEAERVFRPEQERRELAHPWESEIEAWLEGTMAAAVKVSARQILADCLKIDVAKQQEAHSATVGRVMARLGWQRHRAGSGRREWFYVRPAQTRQQEATFMPENEGEPF